MKTISTKTKIKKIEMGKERIQYIDIYTIMHRKAKIETIVKKILHISTIV